MSFDIQTEEAPYVCNLLRAGETPTVERVLNRLGEKTFSWLSKDTENLIPIPVDLNMMNVLATNFVNVTREELKIIQEEPFIKYSAEVENLVITFKTTPLLKEQNLRLIKTQIWDKSEVVVNLRTLAQDPYSLPKIWDTLAQLHLKGVFEIATEAGSYEQPEHLDYMMRKVKPKVNNQTGGLTLLK